MTHSLLLGRGPRGGSLVALALVCPLLGCAHGDGTSLRELPVGLASVESVLGGCASEKSDEDVVRTTCPGNVVFGTQTRIAGTREPLYREEAYQMAQQLGARLVWDTFDVPTEAISGVVDRARAMLPGSDDASATLVGTVRSTSGSAVQEVWCQAADAPGVERCVQLLGALLPRLDERTQEPSTQAGPSATEDDERASLTELGPASPAQAGEGAGSTGSAGGGKSGPVRTLGRSLALPASCEAVPRSDGGEARCRDGTHLVWRRFEEMAAAVQMIEASLMSVGIEGDGESFPCTVFGEVARCAAHPGAVAGLTYLDGKAVGALCIGAEAARSHVGCSALLMSR